MWPDGHFGFREIAHAIAKFQDDWMDIRTSLHNHLESYDEGGDANPYVLVAGTEFKKLKDSLECHAAEGAPCSQWIHNMWHGRFVTDLYNAFLVGAEKIGGTEVLIRAPTGFTLVNALHDTIRSGHVLIGQLFDTNCQHLDALELSAGVRALLADRAYSSTMLSKVRSP